MRPPVPGTLGEAAEPRRPQGLVFAFCTLTPKSFHHDLPGLQAAHVGPRGRPDLANLLPPSAAGGPGRAWGRERPESCRPKPVGVENGASRVSTRGAEPSQAAPSGGPGERDRHGWGARTVWPAGGGPGFLPQRTPPLEFYSSEREFGLGPDEGKTV